MPEWYNTFDSFFFVSIATLIFGSIGLCVRYSFNSKCTKLKLCCIEILRDVEVEEKIEELNTNNNNHKNSNSSLV